MKIRQENMETLGKLLVLMSKRNDLRIGQAIYNALKSRGYALEQALFVLEDETLLDILELYLAK